MAHPRLLLILAICPIFAQEYKNQIEMSGKYEQFLSEVRRFMPEDRIYTDELRRLAWGTDAGFYRMTPKVVLRSDNEAEIAEIMKSASGLRLPVTFRAAGTSLSGQAVSDSVLVVAGKHWDGYAVADDRLSIRLQPGVIGARVNEILAPYGRKFGPDPASIKSCMVGGIVMNNASGMSCGTHANSDCEMLSARMVLPDGTILDTADADSRKAFAGKHPDFLAGFESIRRDIIDNQELAERIRFKYSIKNVTGLNLLPFIRFTDPFDIIAHLLVGSEGTLAFMSEVTMKTLPMPQHKACAMIYFHDIRQAASAVVAMKNANVSAAELLDKRSLAAVSDPEYLAALEKDPGTDCTAVLTQVEAGSREELQACISAVRLALERFGVECNFTEDPEEYSKYWAVRSGIFPMVGGMRKIGTTCLIEDVAFHLENLPEATADLSELLDRHGYDDSCIYGHALEGNFHFIINQSFEDPAEVERYEAMIEDVARLVVGRYDGSLKAEHGTGRNMAPYVKYEWGESAYAVMRRVKDLFDPSGILNPGVIFNDDPKCHLKNFKPLPILIPASGNDKEFGEAYARINKCIECGFCEVNCVSCGFTLSSRTRIVARREIARLRASGEDNAMLEKLEKQYRYLGNETCAGDGLCSMSCPMGINVGDLTHDVRAAGIPADGIAHKVGDFLADHFSGAKTAIRGTLRLAGLGHAVLGDEAMSAVGRGLHKMGLPLWTPSMPEAYRMREPAGQKASALKVVYFPSCLNQMMGTASDSNERKPLAEEMTSLLNKAGYEVVFPENRDSLCCGTIWESKGMPDIADRKAAELEDALWAASEEGKYPVLCDQSPCLHRMRRKIKKMRLYEPAEFIWEYLKDRLVFERTDEPVAVHVTCSMKLMGLDSKIIGLASLCSSNVIIPEGVGCCGFAGDKGMNTPELNEYALRKLKGQLNGVRTGYSNSRTCEIGLSHHSGIPYVSIAYLVNRHTR